MRWLGGLRSTLVVGLALAFPADAAQPAMKQSTHHYGAAVRNMLDLYRPSRKEPAPILLFIHGGGWSAGSKAMGEGHQPAHFVGQGFAWAALNYRFVPEAAVEDQAGDIAQAIAWLIGHAKRFNLDPDEIILVGHSSGVQLAGLIATDPQWLNAAGVPFASIRGVISLDGAGIDVPGIMAAGAASSPFYAEAFGSDVQRQTRLSPFAHIGAPDAPNWLFLYDRIHNQPGGYFAENFAEAAGRLGTNVRVVALDDTTHMKMLVDLGQPGSPVTTIVDQYLSAILAPK